MIDKLLTVVLSVGARAVKRLMSETTLANSKANVNGTAGGMLGNPLGRITPNRTSLTMSALSNPFRADLGRRKDQKIPQTLCYAREKAVYDAA